MMPKLKCETLRSGLYRIGIQTPVDIMQDALHDAIDLMSENPLKLLQKNIRIATLVEEEPAPIIKPHEYAEFLTAQCEKDTPQTKEQIDSELNAWLEPILTILKYEPAALFNECVLGSCPMNRAKIDFRKAIRGSIENEMNKVNVLCSVGPGFFFQDLELVTERASTKPLTYVIFDNFRDYFETIGAQKTEEINLADYHGPLDRQAKQRSRWAALQTLRFVLLQQWLAELPFLTEVYLCTNPDEYKGWVVDYCRDHKDHRFLTLGIDLVDDFAEWTLSTFYKVDAINRQYNKNTLTFHFSAGAWDVYKDPTNKIASGHGKSWSMVVAMCKILYGLNKPIIHKRLISLGAITALIGVVAYWALT